MNALVYDGTWECLLSAVFEAYNDDDATISAVAEPSLFGTRFVITDLDKAHRVTQGMERLGSDVALTAFRGFLAERPGFENDLLMSLRLGFRMNYNPFTQMQLPYVNRVCMAEHRATAEAHRFMGIARFVRADNGKDVGLYIGDIEPDCNILPLLGQHFHDRFPDQRLILRDLRRGLAMVSDERCWWITELPPGKPAPLPQDSDFAKMWKSYFNTIAQRERVNPRLQKHFVPLKYRKQLPEFSP